MTAIENLNTLESQIGKYGALTIPSDVIIQGNLTLETPPGFDISNQGPPISWIKGGKTGYTQYIGGGTGSAVQWVLQREDNSAGDVSIWNTGMQVDGSFLATSDSTFNDNLTVKGAVNTMYVNNVDGTGTQPKHSPGYVNFLAPTHGT